ncbi:MAG TPA: hypothetical protein VF152_14495 [Acidimicrobiia bacterium]
MNDASDPVAARRAVIARRVGWASRVGYGALGMAVVAFLAGLATDFPSALVNLTIAGLVAACLILPITIILGYGIRAATREDRESGATGGGRSP